jgi:hypothetical protein
MTASVYSGAIQTDFVKVQTTYDTIQAFVAADGVSPIRGSFKIEPEVTFEKLKEACASLSLQGEVKLNRKGKWSGQFLVKPNAAGTAPDIGEMLKAGLGVETVSAGTSVTYSLSDTVVAGLQLLQHFPGHRQIMASGAWVEQITVEATANALVTVTFSGGFARCGWITKDVVGVGGIAAAASTCPLDDASRGCVGVGGVFQFENDDGGVAGTVLSGNAQTYDFSGVGDETLLIKVDGGSVQTVTFVVGDFVDPAAGTAAEVCTKINSSTTGCIAAADTNKVRITSDKVGSSSSIQVTGGTANSVILDFSTVAVAGTAGTGYTVTAVDHTTGAAEFTFSPAIVSLAGAVAGDDILPWAPTPSVSGTPIAAVNSEIEFGTLELGFMLIKANIKTGVMARDKEASSDRPVGLYRAPVREIEVECQMYQLDENTGNMILAGYAHDSDITHDVDIRLGPDTAAARMKISVPKGRADIAKEEHPEADVATMTTKIIPWQSSTAGDEFAISFD